MGDDRKAAGASITFDTTWASGGDDAIIARANAGRQPLPGQAPAPASHSPSRYRCQVAIGSDPLEPGQHMSLETAERLARWILSIRAKAEKAGALKPK